MILQRFSKAFSRIEFPSLMNIWDWNWEKFFFMFHKLSWWLLVVIHSPSCVWLCDPMDFSTPGSSVLHCFPELAQTHVHWVSDGFNLTISSSATPFSFCLHPRRKWQLTPVFLPGEIHEQHRWIPATSQMCLVLDCLHYFLLQLEMQFLCFNDVNNVLSLQSTFN